MFDYVSHANLIAVYLVKKLRLEVDNHLIPYPLVWENKDVEIKVAK
jgi:hypothetical protein